MTINRQLIAEVRHLVSRRRLLATVVVLIGLSATEGIGLLLLLPLLQTVGVEAGQGASQRVTDGVVWFFAAVGVRPTLAAVLGLYVAVAALKSVLHRWQALLATAIEQDIVIALRQRVYRAIAGVQWVFFARSRTSDFIHVLTSEIDRAGGAAYLMIDLAVSMAIALVYLALAFRMSPVVTSVVTLFGIALAFAVRHKLAVARASGEQLSSASSRLYAATSEHLGSMKTAMSYGAERRHADTFGQLSDDLRSVRVRTVNQYAGFRQLLAIGSTAGLALIVYVSLGMLAVPTAELLVLLLVFARLMPRLTGLYEKVQTLSSALPAFDAVRELESRCAGAARPIVDRPRQVHFRAEVRLERVTFDYNGDARAPAVRDLDLTIPAGSTTAIVGPSGSGKSTIADLLLGLLSPLNGRLLVDGEPMDAAGLESWRDQIGYVPQDTFLFHDTVRSNLRWARPDATDEELWRALELAAADEFVASLPATLETVMGDRGVLVSGGERQRLSLARALLRQPRLLILDEATSSLDSENEARIQDAIDGLHRQMTIVIITHRLSTIRHADVIHVIDQGRLVESGSWDELRAAPAGRFKELWRAQGLGDSGLRLAERRKRRLEAVGQ